MQKHVLFVLLLCLSVACSQRSSNSLFQKVYLNGDPLTLIEDTTLNQENFINRTNYNSFNHYKLTDGITMFVQKTIKERSEVENIIDENNTDDLEEITKYDFQFTRVTCTDYIDSIVGICYLYFNPELELGLLYVAPIMGNSFTLKALVIGDEAITNIELVHNSIKEDKSIFSILLKVIDDLDYGNVLFSFTFKNENDEEINLKNYQVNDNNYHYMYGLGVNIRWESETIPLDVCSKKYPDMAKKVLENLHKWDQSLEGKRKLTSKIRIDYPPFVDVNTNCIYLVDNYLAAPESKYANLGYTYIEANFDKPNIESGDILIFIKEFGKAGVSISELLNRQESISEKEQKILNVFEGTIIHEVGHFIGLGHNFDKSEKSVMSYEDVNEIQEVDVEAVKKLYSN